MVCLRSFVVLSVWTFRVLMCPVETKNIDGETNLKVRNAKKEICEACPSGSIEEISTLSGLRCSLAFALKFVCSISRTCWSINAHYCGH